jgi:uncharacterized protein (UPF0335 family)
VPATSRHNQDAFVEAQMTVSIQTVLAFLGIAVTFGISLSQVVYRSGQHNSRLDAVEKLLANVDPVAMKTELESLESLVMKCDIINMRTRVEAVEEWRKTVRGDMHEVSEELRTLAGEVKQLRTIIEERTDRRDNSPGRRLGDPA